MRSHKPVGCSDRRGFTLVEVMIATSISLMVVAGMVGLFISMLTSWKEMTLRLDADSDVNIAMSRMVYGMGGRLGLRSASSGSVQITSGAGGWTVRYLTGGAAPQTNSFVYSASADTLVLNPGAVLAGRNISYAWIATQGSYLVVTLRVDKVEGSLDARREIGTTIACRNI